MPIDLAQQLAQFYHRYPGGGLTSELLMVHNETYVIRAIAQAGSVMLATAMATDANLELAEDRAKVRVLHCLDIGRDAPTEEDIMPQNLYASQGSNETSTRSQSEQPAATENSAPEDVSSALPPLDSTIPGLDDDGSALPLAAAMSPPQSGPRSSSGSDSSTMLPLESIQPPQSPSAPAGPKPKKSAKTDLTAGLLAPKDLSDIIAKTSVELRRLGWREEDGREHLQAVYGKRSRQQLTDPELVDFLHYLERQPTPSPQ